MESSKMSILLIFQKSVLILNLCERNMESTYFFSHRSIYISIYEPKPYYFHNLNILLSVKNIDIIIIIVIDDAFFFSTEILFDSLLRFFMKLFGTS